MEILQGDGRKKEIQTKRGGYLCHAAPPPVQSIDVKNDELSHRQTTPAARRGAETHQKETKCGSDADREMLHSCVINWRNKYQRETCCGAVAKLWV